MEVDKDGDIAVPKTPVTVDDFVFGSNKRGKEEDFEDYKLRRKREKLQMKVLNKYGRRSWPASKGTFVKSRG